MSIIRKVFDALSLSLLFDIVVMGTKRIMRIVLSSLLGVCLLNLTSAGNVTGGSTLPVLFSCLRISLSRTISKLEASTEAQSPTKELEDVSLCKKELEQEAAEKLAKLDNGSKERINSLVESMIEANGGEDFEGARFLMPLESMQKGILLAIERSGTDLCSIKTPDEFQKRYNILKEDCATVHKELERVALIYREFLNRKNIQSDPTVAKWVRNTYVCKSIMDRHTPHAHDAYQLLKERNKLIKKKGKLSYVPTKRA